MRSFTFPLMLAISLLSMGALGDSSWLTVYNDCCMQTGSWIENGQGSLLSPVKVCDRSGRPVSQSQRSGQSSGCGGGTLFACPDMQPFTDPTDSSRGMGFVAMNGDRDKGELLCSCWLSPLTPRANTLPWEHAFPSSGKIRSLFYQITNTGGLADDMSYDLQVGSGGTGANEAGCRAQFGASAIEDHWAANGWGQGIDNIQQCDMLPNDDLKRGCRWRFQHMWDNPTIGQGKRYRCPKVLTDISGCVRKDDAQQPVLQGQSPPPTNDYAAHPPPPNDYATQNSHPVTHNNNNRHHRGHHAQYGGNTHAQNVQRWNQAHRRQ